MLRSIAVFVLVLATLLATSQAVADSRSRAESNENRWIPSLAITLGVTLHEQDGAAGSDGFRLTGAGFVPLEGDPDRETLNRGDAVDSKSLTSIHVGGMIEIESPSLPLPYVRMRPRIFFGGEFEQVSSQRRNLAVEGTPEQVLTEPAGLNDFSALAIIGRGTAVTADLDNKQFGAWIGVSIPVQLGDWKISFKPAARYLNQKVNITGIFSHGIRDNRDDIANQSRSIATNVFLVQFQDELDVHAIGPGLEIEIEAGAIRSFSASVFVSGGAYRVLSDRKISFEQRALPSRAGLPRFVFDTAFSAELDPWIYRANLGMRFKWKGSPEGWLFGLLGG